MKVHTYMHTYIHMFFWYTYMHLQIFYVDFSYLLKHALITFMLSFELSLITFQLIFSYNTKHIIWCSKNCVRFLISKSVSIHCISNVQLDIPFVTGEMLLHAIGNGRVCFHVLVDISMIELPCISFNKVINFAFGIYLSPCFSVYMVPIVCDAADFSHFSQVTLRLLKTFCIKNKYREVNTWEITIWNAELCQLK